MTALLLAALGCGRQSDPRATSWLDLPVADNVLARRFQLRDASGPGEVVCTREGDPSEVHHGTGAEEVLLFGLLAGSTYACVLEAGDVRRDLTFETEALPEFLPAWTLELAGGGEGYTLFNSGFNDQRDRQSKLLLVDPEGQLRWYYQVPFEAPDLDASYLGGGQFLYGGGFDAPPTIVDLRGRTLFQADDPSDGTSWHHHTERIDSGQVVALGTAQNTDGTDTWLGATVELLDPALIATTPLWTTQRGFDDGWLASGPGGDPYHLNAVILEEEALYVNFRNLSLLTRLDPATGERIWSLGDGGDFALVRADGTPDGAGNWMHGQHAPERDGDRFLFYDNGDGDAAIPRSRLVEVTIDEDARTAEVTWSYTESGWYEPIWGDVDRLPNGNVLFTLGHSANQDLMDPDTTEIVEIDPETLAVRWRLTMVQVTTTGYRAERINSCAVFSNEKYCPPGS